MKTKPEMEGKEGQERNGRNALGEARGQLERRHESTMSAFLPFLVVSSFPPFRLLV
jgi:hypothetical protein